MVTGTNIRTFYGGEWTLGDQLIMRAADHGSWLGTTVFDGAIAFSAHVCTVVAKTPHGCHHHRRHRPPYMSTSMGWPRTSSYDATSINSLFFHHHHHKLASVEYTHRSTRGRASTA